LIGRYIYLTEKIIELMNLESTVSTARPKTTSLRATIPEGIVFYLDLKDKDKIEWEKITIHGKSMVVVKKK